MLNLYLCNYSESHQVDILQRKINCLDSTRFLRKESNNSQLWFCDVRLQHFSSPVSSDQYSQADGKLPEQDEIQPEDSVSNVSGATTSASKTPSLKSRLRYAKRNAKLRAFKKKMEMELTLADLDVEEQKAQARSRAQAEAAREQAEAARAKAEAVRAQADVEKAERDRRRRRAELVIQQATLESELEVAQARHEIEEAVTDKKSATSRVRWQDRGNQNNESSLTLHNALQPTARPFVPAVNVSN